VQLLTGAQVDVLAKEVTALSLKISSLEKKQEKLIASLSNSAKACLTCKGDIPLAASLPEGLKLPVDNLAALVALNGKLETKTFKAEFVSFFNLCIAIS
jgi:hypothetical protein